MVAAIPVSAQWTSPSCPGNTPAAGDFQATELFNRKGTDAAADLNLSEPVQMDVRAVFAAGKYDHTDIIFVERMGNLKWYDGVAKKVTLIGHIDVHGGVTQTEDDNGLMGVIFDPNFETNRWIYLWYSPKQTFNQSMTGTGQNRQLRLARWKLKPDNTLDMASEKILIKILGSTFDTGHSGGPMAFDAYGDLWFAIGNNSKDLDPGACDGGGSVLSKTDSSQNAEWGPSNTHSMRGGFMRIHPDDSPKGYSIPKGNFGEYWAEQFDKQGNATLATQYRDTSKVLPEIYVKGERSNFSCAVHPTKRWLAWGSVNYNSSSDEFNITNHPIFSGYPYFHANNDPTCKHGKNVDKPTNNSPMNSGVTDLPPAIPGTLNNLANVAIGGPIYSFDLSLDYANKFPPQFDNKWLVGGFYGGVWGVTVDTTGTTLKSAGNPLKLDGSGGLFGSFTGSFRNTVQMKFGKDGALYILNYDGQRYGSPSNPGAVRVIYKGACHPYDPTVQIALPSSPRIWADPHGIMIKENGPHAVSLFDLNGHQVWGIDGMGAREYKLADIRAGTPVKTGLYMVRVNTAAGAYSRRLFLY